MTTRTYWLKFPRGFANEYTVGIATTEANAEQYKAEGFERISRDRALREMSDRGDPATQVYARVTIDGQEPDDNRFQIARSLHNRAA